MQKANELEIAQALSQMGQVALWLGEAWQPPAIPDDLAAIATNDWVGVWSDSRDPQLADAMEGLWHEEGRPRHIVQVPDTLDEALGSDFRFADFAPYMFLNGRGADDDPLDEITRDDSRLDKTRELARVQNGLLLIAGIADAEGALTIAAQAGRRADQLRRSVIVGLSPEACEQQFSEFAKKHPTLAAKIAVYPESLAALLQKLRSLTITGEELAIRVGNKTVALSPLLRQEPPITQDYAVLSTQDVAPVPRDGEDESQLLAAVLGGGAFAWRGIARGFAWDGRPELASWRARLSDAIDIVRKGDKKIVVLDVHVEPGSGATVLLSQLAVFAANQNCPTFFHLATDAASAYPRLRTFLTDLYRDIGVADASVPAVIIFDVDSSWVDVFGYLDVLPSRLLRDGRRVVILRARQVGAPWAPPDRRDRTKRDIAYISIDQPLPEHLSEPNSLALASWLDRQYQRLNNSSLPSGWFQRLHRVSTASGCPLLIALSLLLIERYREVVRLGDRLVARLERVIAAVEAERNPPEPVLPDQPDDAVMVGIRRGFQIGAPATVDRDQFYALVIVLASMGCLRVAVPRRVLARLAGIDPAEMLSTTLVLERAGLVLTREPDSGNFAATAAGAAYHTKSATLQLVHHDYGHLFLDCLAPRRKTVLTAKTVGVAAELFEEATTSRTSRDLGQNRIGLLSPILRAMRPGDPDDRDFAEQLVQRFLRVQREKGLSAPDQGTFAAEEQTFRRWQWQHRQEVLAGFSWLPDELVRSSASILHSRAITRAKCTLDENPSQARPLYKGAEGDLVTALELEERTSSDNPIHMLSTLGMVYVHWAHMERLYGDLSRVAQLDEFAENTLREAKMLQLDSSYPSYHLATHKIDTAEYFFRDGSAVARERAATHVAEALELLSGEPEPRFRAEWDELFRRAIRLLGDEGDAVIQHLKGEHKILGWALEALRELNGEFPRQRDVEIQEGWLAKAWDILQEGFSDPQVTPTPIAELLRYAIFSFRADRDKDPAFDTRLEYLGPLVPSRYFEDEPIWQFDYGMLCYQNGQYAEGAKTFRELRRGQKFFYVSLDRATVLTEGPHSLTPQEFTLQVQSVDGRTGQGWARIAYPRPFPDAVPFAVRSFESRDIQMSVRATRRCHITIRPSGPFAEPVPKKRGVGGG